MAGRAEAFPGHQLQRKDKAMTGKTTKLNAFALPLIAVVLAAGAGAAYSAGGQQAGTTACEILASKSGGAITLEGVFHADAAAQGSYQFSVKSVSGAGSTNINQGGGFSARANESATLGRVTLGGSATYEATLRIDANGVSHECAGRVGPNA